MKKPLSLALGAAIIALAYPASAWFLGSSIEATLAEQYRALDEQPYVKLVSRDFQRGLFSSTETATIELVGLSELSSEAPEEGALPETSSTAPASPIQITVRTVIQHGPLAGFSTVAAAVADSELVLTAEQQQQVSALLGDKKPLQIHTVFSLFGGGTSTLSSPAFALDLPKKADGKTARASWSGFQMSVDFSSHMKRYTMQAEAPGLEIKDDTGGVAQFTGLHMSGNQERMFDDVPGFYSGTTTMKLDQLSFVEGGENVPEGIAKQPLLLKQLSYDASIPVNGEFIDLIGKIGVETAQFQAQDYGPVHYDFSLRHLHARSTAELYKALMKWYGDPARLAAKESGSPLMGMEALREPALALLKYSPELHLDRISFKSPQGEAKISASAKLGALQPEELANPFMLLGKLDINADLALPEDIIGGTLRAEQLAAFTEQGYVTRDGNMLHSKITFANGQVAVNGKPFNPMAMGGGE
ncbi:MAG: YdgA family protein [Azonexus sp.]